MPECFLLCSHSSLLFPLPPADGAGRAAAGGADQPYTVEYYYKTAMGPSAGVPATLPQESLSIAEEDSGNGRILSVKIETPDVPYHREDGRWDYRITIKYKNSTVATTATPTKRRSSRSCGRIRRTYKKKSSGGLKFFLPTRTCR